jgi:hypothetical protein
MQPEYWRSPVATRRILPQRGFTCQPRATPWVTAAMCLSPELGATRRYEHFCDAQFRADAFSFHTQGGARSSLALGWLVVVPLGRRFGDGYNHLFMPDGSLRNVVAASRRRLFQNETRRSASMAGALLAKLYCDVSNSGKEASGLPTHSRSLLFRVLKQSRGSAGQTRRSKKPPIFPRSHESRLRLA